MINQNSPLFSKWLKIQSTNPPKATACLGIFLRDGDNDGSFARCCLGNLCSISNLPRSLDKFNNEVYSDRDHYFKGCLPPTITKELNVNPSVYFTHDGKLVVEKWLKEHLVSCDKGCDKGSFRSLDVINDYTDLNHEGIGQLIKYLADIERESGVEMFCSSYW